MHKEDLCFITLIWVFFFPVTNLIMLRSINLGWHKSVLLKYFTLSSLKLSPSVRIILSIN